MAGRWIGRGGSITWPPRLPDLTPLDFFLWGYVKNIVYQVKINDLQHLKARIRDTVATVNTKHASSNMERGGISSGYRVKNGAVSKVNKKFISQLTGAQHTPSAAATVQVSHALPAVCFSCLLHGR
jgi:hypothetical protein